MSPRRDKARQKPRKDWLVAVGRGLSPASTRSGKGDATRKKVDAQNLSFSGLEQEEGRKHQPTSSPTSSPSRLRKSNLSLFTNSPLPSQSTSTTSSKVVTPLVVSASPFSSPTRAGQSAAEGESTPNGCGCGELNESETTVENAGSAEQGGSPLFSGGSRDATPRSLTFASPGKEYWAGRIAASPRNSDSPTTQIPPNNKNIGTRGISSTGNTGRGAFVFKSEYKLRLGATVASIPGGDPQAMLSEKQTSGYSQSSAWSTQASIFSASSGRSLSLSPGETRQSGTSPVGKTPPERSSWTPGVAMSGDAMSPMTRFQNLNVHSTIQTRATSFNTASVSSFRRAPRSLSPVPQASGLAKRGKTSISMDRLNLSTDSKVREGATSSSPTTSSRFRRAPRSFSPAENHPGASPGPSVSFKQRQVPRLSFFPQASPTNFGSATTPPSLSVSPYSFSSITAEVGHEEKVSPERTTPPRECPEITAPLPSDDDLIESSTCLVGEPEGSVAYGVDPSGDRSIGDGTEECSDYDGETGMEDYGDLPARPLHSPPISPASRKPRPCITSGEHHHVFVDDMEQACRNLGQRWSKTSAAALDHRSASRDDEEVPIRVYLPQGVCAEILHVSSPSSSGASASGSSNSRDGVAAESRVLVSTPTGDGDAADLSLWVTVRGDTTASISSPSRNGPADKESASCPPYHGGTVQAPEGDGLVAGEEAMANDLFEDRSAGRREDIECGMEGSWFSFVKMLLWLQGFCCSRET